MPSPLFEPGERAAQLIAQLLVMPAVRGLRLRAGLVIYPTVDSAPRPTAPEPGSPVVPTAPSQAVAPLAHTRLST